MMASRTAAAAVHTAVMVHQTRGYSAARSSHAGQRRAGRRRGARWRARGAVRVGSRPVAWSGMACSLPGRGGYGPPRRSRWSAVVAEGVQDGQQVLIARVGELADGGRVLGVEVVGAHDAPGLWSSQRQPQAYRVAGLPQY